MADTRSLIEDAKKKKNMDKNQFLQEVSATREQRTGVSAEQYRQSRDSYNDYLKTVQIINRANSRASALDAQFKKWAADYDSLVNEYRSRFSGRSGTYKDPFLSDIGAWTDDYNARFYKLIQDTYQLRSSLDQNKDLLGEDLNPMLDEAVKNLAKIREGYSSYNSFYGQFKDDEESTAEDKYKQWQEHYWATSDETRKERDQWYDDSLKKLKTMPDGEEKEDLQAKVNRYIRGEGEFSISDREDGYATGFVTPFQDDIAFRLSDPAFRENANKAAAATHIPDAEEAEYRMNLELSGYSERDPMFGDNYFVSDYDGTALVSDGKGGFIHPELKTGKYSNDDRLGIYLSLGEGDIKNSADKDIRSVTWNEGNSKHWDYMTTDEVVYYYGLRAENPEKADQFLDDIQRDLNHRYQLLTNIETAEYYRKSPWYGKILLNAKALIDSNLYALPAAISTWSATAAGEAPDIYGPGFKGMHYYDTVTYETADDLNEEFPNFEIAGMTAGDIYQSFMSGLSSIAMSFVPGGQFITAASAAAHDAMDKYREGATAQQIGVSSATAFGTELLTEQLRLERLSLLKARDVATWTDFWKNVVKSMGVEYGEEGLSYLINGAVDVMNRKSQSEWAEMLEKNDGNYFNLALDILGEANKEGVSGAFAGGGSAAITTVGSAARGVNATKSIGSTIKGKQGGVDALKAVATEQSPLIDKGLAKYAAKTTADSSDKRVGKLALRSRQATTATETAAKLQVLESQGYSAKDARDLLRTADTYSMGGQISKAQKAALDKAMSNPDVADILVNKPISFVDNLGHRITFEQDSTQRIRNLERIKKTIDAENSIKLAEDGKAVNPDGFVEEDGELKVKTDDGTVSHEDMRYDSTEQGIAYETIYGLGITDANEANRLLNGHTEADGLTDSEWSEGVTDAFLFGRAGVDFDAMATTPTTAKLLDTQRMAAYRIGQAHMGETDTQDNIDLRNALKEEGKRLKRKPGEKGVYVRNQDGSYTKVSDYMAANKDLNKRQTTAIRVMQEFSDVMGARVNLFQAFEEDGKKYYINHLGKKIEGNPNGFYDKSTGEIYVAMDAGATKVNAFTDTMLFTFAHEVTHFIKDWSPTHFEKIASTLIRQAGFDGKMADLIADQQDKAMRIRKEKISEETALEELVADSMETILRSGRVVETMAKIKKVDAEAHAKLKGWFKKLRRFLRRMVDVYGDKNANTAEGQIVEGFAEDLLQQLEHLFAEGAVEAGKNYKAAREQDIDALAEDGIVFDEATDSVFALRDSFATNDVLSVGRKNFDVKAVAEMISNVTGRSIEDSEKWVRSELTIANMVLANPEFLDFAADSRYEAIKKNSDYPQGTVDLSNLCPKREEFTAMFDLLQKTYPNKLFTAQDIAEMRKILSDAGITVACGACFVEDRRQLIGEIADTFIGMWTEAVNTGSPLKKTNADGKKIDLLVTKELATKYGLTPGTKIVATDTYIPNQYDLTTYEGFRLLEKNHPQIAMGFNRYNNSRGQQSARLIEGRAEYKRQILGWSPAKVKSVNNNGGLRIFSFSDFEVVHLLDLVQVVIDCAAKGVKIQGYTKIPAFAKLVRNTGIKLNRSLIPLGDLGYHMEDGKVVLDYDSTEGIDINDDNFLDERNNPNVGNIVIGINPTQIGAAMLDPFIDYIIPFHSNKAKAILKKLGTGEWINYKESQHERDILTGKASKKNVNIYTQVINKYNPGNKVDFVNAFLKECQKQGKIPRYAEFLNKEYTESGAYQDEYGAFNYTYREGYHKLLVDFKMFDSNGNILLQGEITPDLENGFMQELLNAEVDRKRSYQFPQEVYDAIDERFGDHDLAMSDRDDTYIAAVNRGDMETAQRMVDEAAKRAGYMEEVFHGMGNRHNVYKSGDGQYGPGVYFTYSDKVARSYGKVVDHLYVKVGKIADYEDAYKVLGKQDDQTMDAFANMLGFPSFDEMIEDWDNDPTDVASNPKLIDLLTNRGFEGFVDDGNAGFVLWDFDGIEYRIKSADPVTYDDDGNVIPISQRFNQEKDDIRYSDRDEGQTMLQERDTESLSNRALLANAFERLAQTDLEKQKLQEYKENISKLVEQDAKLKDLRSQIKDLSFGSKDILSASNIENRLRNGERSLHGYVVKDIRPGVAKKRQASYILEAKGSDGKVTATTYRVSASEDIYKAIATKIAADARQKKIQSLQEEARKTANRIDVYDGILLRFESAESLRNVLERAKKKATDKANERRRAALKEVRNRRDISDLKKKIRKDIMDLKKLYTLSKDGANVVEGMREVAEKAMATAEVLFAENYNEDDMILNGVGVATTEDAQKLLAEAKKTMENLSGADGKIEQDLKRKLSKLKKQLKPTFEEEWKRINEKTATSLMDDLKNAYQSMEKSDKAYIRAAYDSNTIEHLETIKENVGATRIADMTLEQLSELHKAYRMVLHSIRTANKAFTISRSISDLAIGLLADMNEKKLPKGKASAFVQNTLNRYGWNYEKLYYALRRIDSKIFTELFTNLANSENTVMRDVKEAAARQMELVNQYGYNKWEVNRKIDKDFVDNTGKKFRLTLGEMMSLYAFSRRNTVWDHMEYGGFQFGKTALTDTNPTATYKLNKAQCEAITANLTKEQQRFVEEMQEYLSTVMAEKGNEVSMLLHGVKLFGEKDYFPLHVSGSYKPIVDESKSKESKGFSTMKNAGFTNAQNKNAKAVFVLEGFMDVWTDHVNEMSRYHGTVPALEDIRRVMNYAPSLETDTDTVAVQATIESRFGKDAVAYFDSLYREANSGAAREKLTEKSQKWLSRFRKGSVINKVSVAIQQPGSISRAYAIIPQKYFSGIKGHGSLLSGAVKSIGNKWTKAQSKTYEKMLKYAPGVTMAKEIGGFDTASGQSIKSYLMDTGKGVWSKIKTEPAKVAAGAIVNFTDDTLANVPNAMDKLAWIEIWRAAERMTAAQNPSMDTNTDAFGEKVGELFTETIRATQVYDSIFSKSPLLKSQNTAVQYMVSFMNEPNTTANMIEDAVRCLVRGDKRRAVRTFYSVVKSVIFTNVLKAIWSAARDDDEDETYVEKYIEALVGGLIQDATIFNYIPGARDVWSFALGYDTERPDLTMLTRVISATENLISLSNKDTSNMTERELAEWEADVDDATWDLIFDCAGAFGIGAGNIRMEVNAVENLAKTLARDYETTDNSLEDAVDRAITKSTPKLFRGEEESKTDKLYDAIVDGDNTYVNRIRSQYKDKDGNFDQDKYDTAVRKALRDGDPRIRKAAIAYHDGDYTEYDSIMDEIEAECHFDREIIAGAVKAQHNDMFPSKKESKDTAKAEYDGDDLRRAIVSGDADEIGLVKDNMIQTDIANGKTEEEANESFMSKARSEIKKAFKEDSIDEDKAVDLLVEYGQEEEAAVDTVNHLAFQLDYPEYKELSMTDVRDWYEYAEGVVPLEIYYDFTMKAKDIEGDDRNGDGKADSGSKKRKIQELARSYGLTGAQIRALMNTQ